MRIVFYSWQSDLPSQINKKFIENCLKNAISKINKELRNKPEYRDSDKLILDQDTSNVPGSPPITDTILNKIDKSYIFIVDLTNVGKIETNLGKFVPNPNVLIEYGYALKTLKHTQIIALINKSFGDPTEKSLPFDLNHLRWPIDYHLDVNSDRTELRQEKSKLIKELTNQIKLILATHDSSSNGIEIYVMDRESKFYILKSNKLVLRLKFKINNPNSYDTNIVVNEINILYDNHKLLAIRRSINIGSRLETISGSVAFGENNKTFNKDEDIRVSSFGSNTEYLAFESNKEDTMNIGKFDKLKIEGIGKSLDGQKVVFKGLVPGYY